MDCSLHDFKSGPVRTCSDALDFVRSPSILTQLKLVRIITFHADRIKNDMTKSNVSV